MNMKLDSIAFIALAGLTCLMLWKLSVAIQPPPIEPSGSVATFDFTSRFGTHHVLTQLGTVADRDTAIRRHIDDFMALKAAIERIP